MRKIITQDDNERRGDQIMGEQRGNNAREAKGKKDQNRKEWLVISNCQILQRIR